MELQGVMVGTVASWVLARVTRNAVLARLRAGRALLDDRTRPVHWPGALLSVALGLAWIGLLLVGPAVALALLLGRFVSLLTEGAGS